MVVVDSCISSVEGISPNKIVGKSYAAIGLWFSASSCLGGWTGLETANEVF